MSNAVRGTKRHCRNCGAKFYDLGREPITCPICHAVYELGSASARVPAAARAPAPAPAPVPEEEVTIADDSGPEVISLEEADAESGGEDDIPDLEDVQEEIPTDSTQDVFLEEEEDESDVSGFIGGTRKSEEEP